MNSPRLPQDDPPPAAPALAAYVAVACSCGQKLSIRPEFRGKKVRCPGCQKILLVSPDEATQAFSGSIANHSASHVTHGATDNNQSLLGFLSAPQAADEIGRLGGYRILKILGHGGMGVVYKAEDPRLGRFVALKAILPGVAAAATMKERFFREARAAAAIKHDHVVSVFQIGEERGVPFVAMEFLEGESLEQRLKREIPLPMADTIRIGREIALGLAAAHKRGLIHRDIKPANIWLESETNRTKILDFGLARSETLDPTDAGQLTQSGMIVGTPAYMPPEQAKGGSVDQRCDLYSLGVILYRTSTGELPIKGDNPIALLSNLALETPIEPCVLNNKIPPELNGLIVRLLAKEREDRPASAQDVVDALQAIDVGIPDQGFRAGTPRLPHVPSGKKSPSVTLRRHGGAWIAIGVCAVFVTSLAAGYFLLSRSNGEAVEPVNNPQKKDPPQQNVAGLSAFDRLDRKDIPLRELKVAGGGDPTKAPAELVALMGDSRFQHHANGYAPGVLAVSPDNRLIASAIGEFEVRLWDADTGELVRCLPSTSVIRHLIFSPDGETLDASQERSETLAWNVRTGARTPALFPGDLTRISFSRDGKRAAANQVDGKLSVWDLADRREILTVAGDPETEGVISPDGLFAAIVKDRKLHLWDIDKNMDGGIFADIPDDGKSCTFSPDGKTLVAIYASAEKPGGAKDAIVCDVATRKTNRKLKRNEALFRVSYSADSRFVLTAGNGLNAEIWDLHAAAGSAPEIAPAAIYRNAVLFPDGRRFVSAEVTARLSVRDRRGKMLGPEGDRYGIYQSCVANDSIFGNEGYRIWKYDVATQTRHLVGDRLPFGPFDVSNDGRKLAFNLFGNKAVFLLDPETGARNALAMDQVGGDGHFSLVMRPDGGRVAFGSPDSVHVWDDPNAKARVILIKGRFIALTDNDLLIAGHEDKVSAYDLKTEKPLWPTKQFATFRDMRASRDGKLLVLAHGHPQNTDRLPTRVIVVANGAVRHTLPPADSIAISPDGSQIALLKQTGVSIWNSLTGVRIREISFPTDELRIGLDFAPDGRHLVVANGNGVIAVYRLANP